jgi:hypothetical protein
MSDFFDDLGKALRRAADSVTTEVSVAAQEQRLKEAYHALGRLHYEAVQTGKTPQGEDFDAQMAKIRAMIANIHETRRSQTVTDSDFA